MNEFYLENNKIYYRKNDFLKRPTIVFVHGISGSSSAWAPYEERLKSKYNIISMDIRGHGKSFRPKKGRDYAIKEFSKDIYLIAKKEKLHRFILVSHSFGNLIALDFVKKHQKMLKALIMISPNAAPSRIKFSGLIYPITGISKLLDYLPQLKKNGGHIDYKKYLGGGDWNIRRIITDSMNTGFRSYMHSLNQAYKFDMREFLPKIKIPTLIIHGSKDTIFPISHSMELSKEIKKSKFIVFEGSDHIIVSNNFEKLSREIDSFIRSLG